MSFDEQTIRGDEEDLTVSEMVRRLKKLRERFWKETEEIEDRLLSSELLLAPSKICENQFKVLRYIRESKL